jgi:hypothetical protein
MNKLKLPPLNKKTLPLTDRPSTLTVDTKLVPIETAQTPRKIFNPSLYNPLLDRSKLERPKTASRSGKRPPYTSGKGGRKTRKAKKAKKSKNIRNNRNSKSKRKTRKK